MLRLYILSMDLKKSANHISDNELCTLSRFISHSNSKTVLCDWVNKRYVDSFGARVSTVEKGIYKYRMREGRGWKD